MSREYKAVPGFFAQDDPAVLPQSSVPPRFGLIDTSPERWTKFRERIRNLNQAADDRTSYKVFFFGRHGEGFHNVAQDKYGPQAWDDYWSKLDGDGEMTWGPDPELTAVGKGQVAAAHKTWKTELPSNIPLPEKLYSSPLTRAMQTCVITFDGIITDENRKVFVLEDCREEYGEHTCDKRQTRSYIERAFPRFQVEEGFTEEDELWTVEDRETGGHAAERARNVLDKVFVQDDEIFISVSAHAGIINGFLACLGRQPCALPTGGVLPVVVKSVLR